MSTQDNPVTLGFVEGGFWRTPRSIQILRALNAVSDEMSVRTGYASGRWFYRIHFLTPSPACDGLRMWVLKTAGLSPANETATDEHE
jgi:hypothetical protein